VTELAKALKIETVAEGVETREHLDTVEGAGCEEVQGFYFSHPVPSSEVAEVLALCRLKCIAVTPLSLSPPPQPRRQSVTAARADRASSAI
jgi:predicted signal transduction protein with EAL and GGDEF domain